MVEKRIEGKTADEWYQEGEAYADSEKYEEAIKCFDKALELDPDDVDAWVDKGNALDELERYEEAIKCYDKALEINSKNSNAWNLKGYVLQWGLKRYEEAIKCYDKVLEINPKDAKAWNKKGEALVELERYEEAIRCFGKALELNPDDVDAWFYKGGALGELERYEEAIRCFDKALEIDPKDAVTWCIKGNTLDELEGYEEAIRCFDKAIEIDPDAVDAWIDKGSALDELERYEEAIRCFDKALEIDPKDAEMWNKKGSALDELERYEEAVRCYDKALEINPKDAYTWNYKGYILLFGLKRYEEAIKCYDKALEINPKDTYAWGNKGITLGKLMRHEEAIRCYNKVLEITPNDEKAMNYRKIAEEKLREQKQKEQTKYPWIGAIIGGIIGVAISSLVIYHLLNAAALCFMFGTLISIFIISIGEHASKFNEDINPRDIIRGNLAAGIFGALISLILVILFMFAFDQYDPSSEFYEAYLAMIVGTFIFLIIPVLVGLDTGTKGWTYIDVVGSTFILSLIIPLWFLPVYKMSIFSPIAFAFVGYAIGKVIRKMKGEHEYNLSLMKVEAEWAKKRKIDVSNAENILKGDLGLFGWKKYKKVKGAVLKVKESTEEYLKKHGETTTVIQKAKEIVEEAKDFGCVVQPAESLLNEANLILETTLKNGDLDGFRKAERLANESQEVAKRIKEKSKPKIKIALYPEEGFRPHSWQSVKLEVLNVGEAHAKDIEIHFSKEVEVKDLKGIDTLNRGESKELGFMLKPIDKGEIPVDVTVNFRDLDETSHTDATRFYLDVTPEVPEVRKEEIKIPIENKERALIIERAIYDPCKGDFIERALPRMKEWVNSHDPCAYWFAISLQNNADKAIEEWSVELETSAALKIEEAKIEGIEIEIPHEAHLGLFKISVPKEYGIVIPKGGTQRVYFKLRAEKPKTTYKISGVFKSAITGDVPIRAKEFKYLCDAGVSPEAVKAELKKTFSEKDAARLALSFKTVQEIDRMCNQDTKTEEYLDKLLVLKNYTEGFSDTFTKQLDEFSRFMKEEQIGYLDDEYKGKVRRFCTNLVDVWISEFLKG